MKFKGFIEKVLKVFKDFEKSSKMHLCSHNLRFAVMADGNLVKAGSGNTISGVSAELYNKFFFSKGKR